MGGTKAGAAKAVQTIYKYRGRDFFVRIGKIGGKLGHTGGFASKSIGKDGLTGQQRASIAGKKGGFISRRGKVQTLAIPLADPNDLVIPPQWTVMDDKPFKDGFYKSSWKSKMLKKLKG